MKDHDYDLKENCFKKRDANTIPTHNNELLGTADYLAPELLYCYEPSFATDMWAYGCILYFLIEGRTPFKGSSNTNVFENIIKNELEFSDRVHLIF